MQIGLCDRLLAETIELRGNPGLLLPLFREGLLEDDLLNDQAADKFVQCSGITGKLHLITEGKALKERLEILSLDLAFPYFGHDSRIGSLGNGHGQEAKERGQASEFQFHGKSGVGLLKLSEVM